jgi:hypothetical protein
MYYHDISIPKPQTIGTVFCEIRYLLAGSASDGASSQNVIPQ